MNFVELYGVFSGLCCVELYGVGIDCVVLCWNVWCWIVWCLGCIVFDCMVLNFVG